MIYKKKWALAECIPHRLRNIFGCEDGLAAVEFAFCIPVLLILFFGVVEVSLFVLKVQKLDKTVETVDSIVATINPAQGSATSNAELLQLTGMVNDLMSPYWTSQNGIFIVTDVSANPSPTINWQYCPDGAKLNGQVSQIGTGNGSSATLPSGFTMNSGDEVIITEVYYSYTPLFLENFVSPVQLYRTSINPPSNSTGTSLAAITNPVPTCP